ncbi:dihydrolipoamide acetyltransferase family protein [Nocardia arizonensis]|uniref:dihydrolipoamide acetyltransferase family protein n=1 Tax=Nocardia arizonensis TaxID=1141647 RepID=UPI0006D1130A|nr:dihydrolipoamide acetyltransferase family protein [Nocardia arizonensis]
MQDDGHVLEFRLPDLGEGLADAELLSWSVDVGDTVELNQTIGEVETAKAVVSLPSPFSGTVVELLAQPGDTVPVGAPLIRVRTDLAIAPAPSPANGTRDADGRGSVLVGYGPEAEQLTRRRPAPGTESPVAQRNPPRRDAVTGRAAATPAARKLAKELGIDLWYIAGSGPQGAVTVEDVRASVPVSQPRVPAARPPEQPAAPVRLAAREVGTPVEGIRKRIAGSMVVSARTIPQASTFVTLDFTPAAELLDHLRTTVAFTGLAVTPLALVAKAVVAALSDFPGMNATWDDANQQIVTKHYVNLGIAVATERGLLVPNLKEAQTLSLRDLCREIGWLAEMARSGSATPVELRGGTFTLTNIGVFGVDSGVPLVNPGEAAILCLGSIKKRPWVVRDELAVRWVTTVGVSFDHRMIDGELAARFLTTVAALLEDPLTLLSRG